MQKGFLKLAGGLAVSVVMMTNLAAGSLDTAPFSVALPDAGWRLDDSTDRSMGQGVFLAATAANQQKHLRLLIMRTDIAKPSPNSLNDLCTGIRSSFKDPKVLVRSDIDTTFAGHKARLFVYEVRTPEGSTYSETVVFVDGAHGWTIASVGGLEHKDDVKAALKFFKAK